MKSIPLHHQVFLAIIIATVMGLALGDQSKILGIEWLSIYGFFGTLFLNALKMIVVPLIMSSIICGVANLAGQEGLGRIGGKTIGFYLLSGLLAVILGLLIVNLIAPGLIDGQPAGEQLRLTIDADEVSMLTEKVAGRGTGDIVEIFLRMVPPNIISAAANGQMLGLIFFSIIFAIFMSKIETKLADSMKSFWQGLLETMMLMTTWILKFAPLGVWGLVAKTVATTGFTAFQPVLLFFIAVVLSLGIHMVVTLSIMLKVMGNINPLKHMRAMIPALLTAFSTASSSSTLPVTIRSVQGEGVSNKTTSFVLPLGATVNMNGTALYECMAAIFIAQAYGLELTFSTQFLIVITALLTSIGVAGIPAASLVAISVILTAVGLPLEGLGLLLITDRVLDMLRTSVNVYSDA